MSSFRRRMMMAENANSPIGDYIQDGLVFHLDCADYDATLNTWVDKKGNVSFTMSNVTVDSLGGVVFNGSDSKGVASVGLNNPIDSSTIEVAININRSQTQFILCSGVNETIGYGFYNNASYVICSFGVMKPYANTHRTTGSLAHSVCFGNSPTTVVDRNIDEFRTASNRWTNYDGIATIGMRNNNTLYFNGTIYQIRIYNRHLTAEEMIHNQQIDMRKYNSN